MAEHKVYRTYFNGNLIYVNKEYSLLDVNIGASVGGYWYRVGQQSNVTVDYNTNTQLFRINGRPGPESNFYKIYLGTVRGYTPGTMYKTTYSYKGGTASENNTAWFNTGNNYSPYWLSATYMLDNIKSASYNVQNNNVVYLTTQSKANYVNVIFSLSVVQV